jgi:hypothetical protein
MAMYRTNIKKPFWYVLMVLWLALVAPLACPVHCYLFHKQGENNDQYVCEMPGVASRTNEAAPIRQLLALPSPLLLGIVVTPLIWLLSERWTPGVVFLSKYHSNSLVPPTPPPRQHLSQYLFTFLLVKG